MFLNINNLKKQDLIYSQGDSYFQINGEQISFSEISAFFRRSTDHYTNRVYLGTCLQIELRLIDGREPKLFEVDSNHREHYRLLHNLAEAIRNFRTQRLMADYQRGEVLEFFFREKELPLLLEKSSMSYAGQRIETLRLSNPRDAGLVEFVLAEKTLMDMATEISDTELLMALAVQIVPISIKEPPVYERWLKRAFWCLLLGFGINGLLGQHEMSLGTDTLLIRALSAFSMIALGVSIMLIPVSWLVTRRNEKKMSRHKL